MFSLVQGVLLTPPPYRDPDQLVLVLRARTDGQASPPQRWSAAQWQQWPRESKSFEAMTGYAWSFNFLVSDEGSESLEGMFVSRDFFKVLGLQPLLGRTFSDAETTFPAGQVIILGYDVWQRKFGGDPKIVGTPIRIVSGVAAGIVAAVVLSRALTAFLFDVEATDIATLIGVGLLFASVALLACWVPTHRAARIDPLEALRSE